MTDVPAPFGTFALSGAAARLLRASQSMHNSWVGRRAAGLCRRIVLLGDRPIIDAESGGLKLRVHTRDNLSERRFLFMSQFYDMHERNLLTQHLKPGDTFVDVGANAGMYTLTAARLVGPAGRVISIEPNPTVSRRLLFNVAINGFADRVTLDESGVSATEGTFDLAINDHNLGASTTVGPATSHKITVRCRPLSSILQQHACTRVDALKIDIEGAEDAALVPLLQAAPRTLLPKLILIENSQDKWKLDLEGEFTKAGYQRVLRVKMNSAWTLPLSS